MSQGPRVIRVLAAGAALSLSACSGEPEVPIGNPPPPEQPPEVPIGNPPPPESALPSWDDVASGHPEGATNPPRPVLTVTADGAQCWKDWVSPMIPPSQDFMELGGEVVTSAADAKGTEVQCPPEATEVLARYQARAAATGGDASQAPPDDGAKE